MPRNNERKLKEIRGKRKKEKDKKNTEERMREEVIERRKE